MATDDDGPGTVSDLGEGACPSRLDWKLLNLETGQLVPARCGRNCCWYCLPLNAKRRVAAIAMMRPRRSITLTDLAPSDDPDPWPTVRRRYRRTREYLQREGIDPGLWALFVERGSATGMVHGHVAQLGPRKLPMDALQDAAHRAGAGWTRVETIRAGHDFASYVGKGFASYVGKTFGQVDDGGASGREALRINGGRLGHFSRGYFTGPDGATLGVRQAEKLATREEVSGRWVLVRTATL